MLIHKKLVPAMAALAFSLPASATSFTLDFEGVGNLARILDFYNGGTDSAGHRGPDYDVTFGSNALGLIDRDVGGDGNIANEPSPSTTMIFLNGSSVLNYAPGFSDGFSFYYSTVARDADVSVYDGLNATGNLLGSIHLSALGFGHGDPTGDYGNWVAAGLSFNGIAKSIDFNGTANYVTYDNITFGSAEPGTGSGFAGAVPEPEAYALMLAGCGVVGLRLRRRQLTEAAVA